MGNEREMKGCEHPRGCFSTFRDDGKRGFHVESHFKAADANDNEFPLAVFGKLSRLVFTIIDKRDGKKKYCTVNMQYDKIAEFVARGNAALKKYLDNEIRPSISANTSDTGTSPAYTVRMTMGKYKGKTVAEILAENPNCGEELNKQYEFLSKNADKYENNRKQMEAIDDAANIIKNGGSFANAAITSSAPYIKVVEPVPLPQIRKKREDGLCPVAELEVVCDCSRNSPFIFTVTNYFAPVDVAANGKLNAKKSAMQELLTQTFSLTVGEWCDMIDKINIAKEIFLFANGVSQQKISDEWDNKNRKGNIS